MATVRLSFSPAPVHVRTARLVGVAVARRAGVAEQLLDEVRLAMRVPGRWRCTTSTVYPTS